MIFGSFTLAAAEGAVLAHAIRLPDGTLTKGSRLGPAEIARLAAAGIAEVVGARLEPGDMAEDHAAGHLASAVAGPGIKPKPADSGRANLHAAAAGVLRVAPAAIEAFNGVDEAITLATLADYRPVAVGELVATVKVIPYAVPAVLVEAAAAAGRGLLSVAPYCRRRVAVISTLLPGLPEKVVAKTLAVTAARLERAGAGIAFERRVAHAPAPLAEALAVAAKGGAELIVVFGASAIADRRDVIPAALEAAGGRVIRLGMPVDPGNLLLLGELGGLPVLGAPGCARSPKENGFDFILARLLAGIAVSGADMARLGLGGLLGDIPTRPHPRAAEPPAATFAAVILAAGQGTRMGAGTNKLLERIGGVPVVRRAVETALASRARPVIVVTGHDRARVEAALAGLDVVLVHNRDHARGMAGSLKAGIGAVPEAAPGALVALGDMPLIERPLIDRLIAAHAPQRGRLIAVPVSGQARGHPVLWSRRYFPELMALEGDVGARHLLARHAEAVAEVDAESPDAFLDVDTPELLAQARAAAEAT